MRSIRIDQFEFADHGSEEAVEIDVSRQSRFPHPDVGAFVKATIGVQAAASLGQPQPFFKVSDRERISEYVKHFSSIELPLHADWPTYTLTEESWDSTHVVICGPDIFIRYQWSTSA